MSNLYAVLDSDDEEEITPVAPEVVTPAAKTAKAAPSISPVTSNKPVESNVRGNNNNQNKGKNASGAANSLPAKTSNEFNSDVAKTHVHAGNEGKGGKPHGGRRDDRDGNHANARKREYERHSGTGRGKEISKGGAGGHNWGNEKLEALTAEKSLAEEEIIDIVDAPPAADGAGWGEDVPATPVVEGDAVAAAEPVPEPEIPTFTFDEFMEKRQQARSNVEYFGTFQERVVSEEAFAGLRAKDVSEDEEFFAGGISKAIKKKEKKNTVSKSQPPLELGFKSVPLQSNNREDRPRRDGGGGSGGRGRGGRGGGEGSGRGERRYNDSGSGRRSGGGGYGRQGNGIDINDSSAFPSL